MIRKTALAAVLSALLATSMAQAQTAPAATPTAGAPVYTLVLLRHGESAWNKENRFTGWSDVKLTEKGEQGALRAGQMLRDAGIRIDEVHTSVLQRAIKTSWLAMEGMGKMYLPVSKYWQLNERCYGALEGQKRDEVEKQVGAEQVKVWRRSFDVRPPVLSADDPRAPVKDPRYKGIDPKQLPLAECTKDVIVRQAPYYNQVLLPAIKNGRTVMVVGHSTQLRSLSAFIDPTVTANNINKLEIGNTTPIIYTFDKDMRVVSRNVLKPRKEKKD